MFLQQKKLLVNTYILDKIIICFNVFIIEGFLKCVAICDIFSFRGGTAEATRRNQCGDPKAGAGERTQQKTWPGTEDEWCAEDQVKKTTQI